MPCFNSSNAAKHLAAVDGGLDPSRTAIEQAHADRALEIGDDLRHRRLRDPEVLCGLRHAAALRDRHEYVQVPQLETPPDLAFPIDLVGHAAVSALVKKSAAGQRLMTYGAYQSRGGAAIITCGSVMGLLSSLSRSTAMRVRLLAFAFPLVAFFTIGSIEPVQSQGWPQKPVRILVPFAPGGSSVTAQRLSEVYAQQFIVENRPGGGGTIATEAVARSRPNGYTLLLAAVPQIAIVPAMTKAPYDPVRDLAPISIIGTNPFVLVVHPSMPVGSIAEFVAYVRTQPGKLSYVASSPGSLAHLSMAMFLKRAGLEMIPVTYKGGGAVPLADVIAGHVPAYFTTLSDVLPHRTSGALKLLVVSSEQRAAQIPDVPTMIESGYPGFKTLTWNGLMAPAGTPNDIVVSLAKEVARAVKEPSVAERLSTSGVDPLGSSPEEFAAQIAADIALWAEAVKIAGVQEK
jgi:tripartite-type tricarboxylate transporter receptor subunit TctC